MKKTYYKKVILFDKTYYIQEEKLYNFLRSNDLTNVLPPNKKYIRVDFEYNSFYIEEQNLYLFLNKNRNKDNEKR